MSGRRRGNLSSTPSLLSIASSAEYSIKEESLPSPTSLAECDDQVETYQILLQAKSKEKSKLIDDIKKLRSEKEPLLKVKAVLQEEISMSNQVINAKSEEVTQLRQKLRHHSEKQIEDNIERLEFQLRNNNYKPREEQKILDEIYMLKRSSKTLKQFELKQKENKKYRAERSRLIDQRNEIFSNVQAIILQEEELKREVTALRYIIGSTGKTVDHLKSIRPDLEKAMLEEKRRKEELSRQRIKEKATSRKEQYILRQQERQKRWEEYEASIEPFEEEKDKCKMLIAYLQQLMPSVASLKVEEESTSMAEPQPAAVDPGSCSSGSFYSKPKLKICEKPQGKRNKARAKREQKAGKVRELSHPPDVLSNLGTFNVAIPRTTEDVEACIASVEEKLKQFTLMGEKGKEDDIKAVVATSPAPELNLPATELKTGSEIYSSKQLADTLKNISSTPVPKNVPKETTSNPPPLIIQNGIATHSATNTKITAVLTRSAASCGTAFTTTVIPDTFKPKLIADPSSMKSFFSNSVPVIANGQIALPSGKPSYASVAANIPV